MPDPQLSFLSPAPAATPPWADQPVSDAELIARLEAQGALEGGPVIARDDLLALSAPPTYVVGPNPFLADQGRAAERPWQDPGPRGGTEAGGDVSHGKNNPLYFAHYYSTKVPPHAIVPFLMHYSEPGDLVIDPFCGTGMTGLAAQLCADAPGDRAGARRAILGDLGPAPTFIAAITNCLGSLVGDVAWLEGLVDEIRSARDSLLHTRASGWLRGEKNAALRVNDPRRYGDRQGRIEYVVWSDVLLCPACGVRQVWWERTFQGAGVKPEEAPLCSACGEALKLESEHRARMLVTDPVLGVELEQAERVPVLVNYSFKGGRYEKHPDEDDLARIREAGVLLADAPLPVRELQPGINTDQPRRSHGFTHMHHFFSARNGVLLSDLWTRAWAQERKERRLLALYLLTGSVQRVCCLNRFMPGHDRHVGPLSGTLYVAPLITEIPATEYFESRLRDLKRLHGAPPGRGVFVTTQSATHLSNLPDESIDYAYTDPPFGGNLNYSEINVLVEPWLRARTDAEPEAIVNSVQGKDNSDYQGLMERSFRELHRVLKPGRYVSVQFQNTDPAVWNALRDAMEDAGLQIVEVARLDKQKGTTKQLAYGTTVLGDLVITARKGDPEATGATHDGVDVWDIVDELVGTDEDHARRERNVLYNRLVARYLTDGRPVPISAGDFYAGLEARYVVRGDRVYRVGATLPAMADEPAPALFDTTEGT